MIYQLRCKKERKVMFLTLRLVALTILYLMIKCWDKFALELANHILLLMILEDYIKQL